MNVVRAESLGMCFGVRDALRAAARVQDPTAVTIHGQLVHNEEVLTRLSDSGFAMSPEASRGGIPETPLVLITAHGVSDRERARLSSAGKALIDTTCPLVRRVHDAARRLQADGCFVLVVGRRDHVEVRGIVEDLDAFDVIESVEDVRAYPATKLGIVCQTTISVAFAEAVRDAVSSKNPLAEIRFVNTVCQPTRDNQRSLDDLLTRVEAVVVVGGSRSNNTKELVALCRSRGTPAFHVQSAADLDPAWFQGFETVGITAGTSTLDPAIDGVHERLLRITRGETDNV